MIVSWSLTAIVSPALYSVISLLICAAGIVSETEAASLRDYDRKVMDLIGVDDFETHELVAGAQPAEARGSGGEYGAPGQVA